MTNVRAIGKRAKSAILVIGLPIRTHRETYAYMREIISGMRVQF